MAAQAARAAMSALRMTVRRLISAAAVAGAKSSADAAAKAPATSRPTGVAITKPVFLPLSRTPGVASACRPRKPALARNVIEPSRSFARQEAENDADAGDDQHEPEVRRVMLPVSVGSRLGQEEPEPGEGEREDADPDRHLSSTLNT